VYSRRSRAAALALLVAVGDAVAQQPATSADTDQPPISADTEQPRISPDTEEPPGELPPGELPPGAQPKGWHGRFQLSRQDTTRGAPGQSTQTKLLVDSVFAGTVNLLRFEFPFPDDKTSFPGDPLDPRPGDVKTRVGFASFKSGKYSFPTFVEVTFPTADPESLGTGKYQLSAGIRMLAPLARAADAPNALSAQLELQAQQVNSVAGDPETKDINYTKFEITLDDTWRGTFRFKLKLKPVVDWTQNGRTGSVAEIEGGLFFRRDWRAFLMLGHRATGPSGIPSTYSDRIELGIARKF
jgi:hypothetical protein